MSFHVDASDHGASPGNTPEQNLVALKAAVLATLQGGTLHINGHYVVATPGLLDAIVIDKPMTVRIDGSLTATSGAFQPNPPYIFKVVADGVTFRGAGALIGDGALNAANLDEGDRIQMPGLLYVEGDNFELEGVTIDSPPKVGIYLVGCRRAKIAGRFIGGPTTHTNGETAYFAIRMSGGGDHLIESDFGEVGSDARYVTAIRTFGLAAANRVTVRNCFAKVHEKLFYGHGEEHLVADNVIIGSKTDAIRINGSRNRVLRNRIWGGKGAVSVYDGSDNDISFNNAYNLTQTGIYFGVSQVGDHSSSKVIGNHLAGTGNALADGIMFDLKGADCTDLEVKDNLVVNFASAEVDPVEEQGLIRIRVLSPHSVRRAVVAGNNLRNTLQNGVVLNRVIDSLVSHNKGSDISKHFLVEDGGAYNRWLDNSATEVGTIGVAGLSSASDTAGNMYTRQPLTAEASCAAGLTTHVNHGGIAPNAQIFLKATTADFATLMAGRWPLATVSGTGFNVALGTGTPAAGVERFAYHIVQ
ncbi:NosD domain-containing protein [Sphingomonas psychrotolerans]|nr:NosD domain-containing protein [Sphingomonas psychrotolerans]